MRHLKIHFIFRIDAAMLTISALASVGSLQTGAGDK